jgi:hypothetical protein
MDIHLLAEQMGTSVAMIEKHYSHLQPRMRASVIAGFNRLEAKLEAEAEQKKAEAANDEDEA